MFCTCHGTAYESAVLFAVTENSFNILVMTKMLKEKKAEGKQRKEVVRYV